MRANTRFLLALSVLLPALVGCKNNVTVTGKVLEGPMSFIGAVDDQDPRLKEPGLEGVTISAVSESGPASGARLGTATSDKKGDFKLSVSNQRAMLYPIKFNASREGSIDANQTMSAPGTGRTVLVILRPRDSAPAGGG
jgi:hypothetical protein